jgi:hypothetical protein
MSANRSRVCHGRPDSQGREVLGCGAEHHVRSAMLRGCRSRQQGALLRDTSHPTRCRSDHHDTEQSVREATDWSDLQARIMSLEHVVDSGAEKPRPTSVESTEDAPRPPPSCVVIPLQRVDPPNDDELEDRRLEDKTTHVSSPSKRSRTVTSFLSCASNPRAQMQGTSRKAPTSIFAIDKSVAFRESLGLRPTALVRSDEVGRLSQGACA